MALVNGASGNPFRVASCGWMPRRKARGFHGRKGEGDGVEIGRGCSVLWPNDRRRQRESVSARCKHVNGTLRLGDGSLGRRMIGSGRRQRGKIAKEILLYFQRVNQLSEYPFAWNRLRWEENIPRENPGENIWTTKGNEELIEWSNVHIPKSSSTRLDEYPSSPSCPTGEQNGSLENQPYCGVLDMWLE